MSDATQHPVLIYEADEIIALAGESKKDYLNKHIGDVLEKTIEGRSLSMETTTSTVEIIEGKEEELNAYCISPIIANGDPIGCVIMLSKEESLSEVEQKVIETASSFRSEESR